MRLTPGAIGQPLDADLTAIAALTTTAFGRSLLAAANAAALRTLADAQQLDSDLTTVASPASGMLNFLKVVGITSGAAAWKVPVGLMGAGYKLVAWQPIGNAVTAGGIGSTWTFDFGSNADGIDNEGPALAHTTGASINQFARHYTAVDVGRPNNNMILVFRWMPQTTVANRRDWLGASGSTSPNADTLGAVNGVGFRASSNAGDTTIKACFADGTTTNPIDTGITWTADHNYVGALWTLDRGVTWNWGLADLTAGTVATGSTSTNVPSVATTFRLWESTEVLVGGAVTRTIKFRGCSAVIPFGGGFP